MNHVRGTQRLAALGIVLGLAWYADIDTERGQESTPIVVDGVMYLTTAWSMVKAYDIKTGSLLWAYDPAIDRKKGNDACCDVVNRGVAAWNGKIYRRRARRPPDRARWQDRQGRLGKTDHRHQTLPYTITGVPRIVKGKVIIGNGGAEYRVRGYVTAYDAETGKQAWRWYTVPGNPANGLRAARTRRRPQDLEWRVVEDRRRRHGVGRHGLRSRTRHALSSAPATARRGTRNIAAPGGGDNLFLSSIVALDPNTGKYMWHYQTTPGETWDYTATQPIMVADLQYPEGKRRVVMQAPKNGFFYVLDACWSTRSVAVCSCRPCPRRSCCR
jgi:quinohemoprotein ethanol dehydrogenase